MISDSALVPHGRDKPLVAHSLAEAYLFLMATPCSACGSGPLSGSEAQLTGPSEPPQPVPAGAEPAGLRKCQIHVTCAACRNESTLVFHLAACESGETRGEAAVVNPTDERSHILDVGQWIMLFRVITEAASKERNRRQARHLGLEAAQCLEEALKFFDDPENDLPAADAFYTDASRERFRSAPGQFSRERLLQLRAKLPSDAIMRSRLATRPRTSWWRRWLTGNG